MSMTPVRNRVLVIDDNEAIHGDFKKTLNSRSPTERLAAAAAALFGDVTKSEGSPLCFEIDTALQGQEGLAMVQKALAEQKPYALAFVDMRMPPGWDGVETIKHLWSVDPELQIVICTAFTDYSWEQITDALGTSDRYLILKKPFDPMEVCQLAAALSEKWKLKRQATMKMDQLEMMVKERTVELRRLALLDRLTALPNRSYLQELLNKAVARAAGDMSFQFAVHFIDMDKFKLINDSLGHEAGDQFLISIADRLREVLGIAPAGEGEGRDTIAGRLGGDEFVILQQNIKSLEQAEKLAQKVINVLGAPYAVNGLEINSGASIGIAGSFYGGGSDWAHDILRDADSAMYVAKGKGGSGYAVFNAEMHDHAMERMTMESDLRRALKNGEFEIAYQPIVALSESRLAGFEALLRWRHPTRGFISPAEFIPVAEETGLIDSIGKWVMEQAVGQLAAWTAAHPAAGGLSISVNVARKQLLNPEFPKFILDVLADAGVYHDRLNIEVTESTIIDDHTVIRGVLSQLKAAGVHIHMDDFGTGYSSLSCLHSLPLDVLKIDRSFILNLSSRRDYMAVIDAIIRLAHNLGIKVIAEGVERAEHTAILCALECDHAQGFFFAKALAAPDAEIYLLNYHAPDPQRMHVSEAVGV